MSYIKRGKYPIANPFLKIRDGKIHAMSKIEVYREKLRQLDDWESYLLSESRLPGPRANLELAHAVAEEGGEALFCAYLKYDEERAPTNSPEEFLAFCGVLGLGKLLVAGKQETFQHLRLKASDSRWRIREAVAFALQRLGKADMEALLYEMESWMEGNLLERRAVVAALCEPSLLKVEMFSKKVIDILESITESVLLEGNRSKPKHPVDNEREFEEKTITEIGSGLGVEAEGNRLLKKVPRLFCLFLLLSDDMFHGLFREIFCALSHIG
jgi:hypothetical protein